MAKKIALLILITLIGILLFITGCTKKFVETPISGPSITQTPAVIPASSPALNTDQTATPSPSISFTQTPTVNIITSPPTPIPEPTSTPLPSTESLNKNTNDLKNFLLVAAHPFNAFDQLKARWSEIFSVYHIQFVDRATALNDVNYSNELDNNNIKIIHDNSALAASYFTQNPGEFAKDWSFQHQYYDLLADSERWKDLQGKIQTDPYKSNGGQDIFGSLIYMDAGVRVRMSLNSPYWLDYQKASIKYALDHGIDAIDIDSPQITPLTVGITGDFNDWSLRAFDVYLQEHYDTSVLSSWGIRNPLDFNYKEYLLSHYVNSSVQKRLSDGQIFFNTSPLDKPFKDPIVREWTKFSYRSLLDFHEELNAYTKEYGNKAGKTSIPYFGNLYLGHPSDPLSIANPSVVLGQAMDIIQIESLSAVPPQRLTTIYKLGLAMGGYEKPVWGLHQPYYGYAFEPRLPSGANLNYEKLLSLYVAETYAAGAIPEMDLGGWPGGTMTPRGLFVTGDGEPLEGLKKYFDFVFQHRDLFIDTQPRNEVALLYSIPTFMWYDQQFWGIYYSDQRAAFTGFARAMEEAQIPYDVQILGYPGIWDDARALKSLDKYKVIVLPLVDCISDSQLKAVAQFVRSGGKLIVVGDSKSVAIRNEDYVISQQPGLTGIINDPGKGTVEFVPLAAVSKYYQNEIVNSSHDSIDLQSILSAFKNSKQVIMDSLLSVGVNVFQQDSRTIVHLVNYDYNVSSDQIVAKSNLNFKIRLQNPDKIVRIELLSPDTEGVLDLQFTVNGDYISFNVPDLKFWDIVVIK